MKKLFLSLLIILSGFLCKALPGMQSNSFMKACFLYDAVSGKVTLRATHHPPSCFNLYWDIPYTTYAFVKNPSGPGFWGPFIVTATILPGVGSSDPPITYYDVTIPGFSTQQCYEIYFVSNKWIYPHDPANTWNFPVGVTLGTTTFHGFPVESTYLTTACVCEDSDPIPDCNSNFRFNLMKNAVDLPPFTVNLSVVVNLIEFHPLSTYFIDWGTGNVPYSGLTSMTPYTNPSGSYTVCLTEITSAGDTCKTCMDYCIPVSYKDSTVGSKAMLMRRTKNKSTEEINSFEKMELYPNPTNGISELKFNLSSKDVVEISVTDIYGKQLFLIPAKLFEMGQQQVEINTQNLPSGIYQVKIKVGNNLITKKLSVSK